MTTRPFRRSRITSDTRCFALLGFFYGRERINRISRERRRGESSDMRSAIARLIWREKLRLHPAARMLVLRMQGRRSWSDDDCDPFEAVDMLRADGDRALRKAAAFGLPMGKSRV